MNTNTAAVSSPLLSPAAPRPKLDSKHSPLTAFIFIALLAAGLLFTAYSLFTDVSATAMPTTTYAPYILLGVALLIALGFESQPRPHSAGSMICVWPSSASTWKPFFDCQRRPL